jgi:hypothetical protein
MFVLSIRLALHLDEISRPELRRACYTTTIGRNTRRRRAITWDIELDNNVLGGAQTRSGLGDPHFGESEGNGSWGEEGRKAVGLYLGSLRQEGDFGRCNRASLCIPAQPIWASYSYLPHPSRPPHSMRLQARVHTRVSRQAAANHLPLGLRE